MIKRTIISVLVVFLLLLSLSPTTVQAADEITILNNSAQVDFPYQLNFSLSAASNYEISDIRLRYIVARTSFVDVFSEADVSFTPATTVDAAWSLNLLMIGGLPQLLWLLLVARNFWQLGSSRGATAPSQGP